MLFVAFLITLLFAACLKEQEYPVEPHITFRGYTKIVKESDTLLRLSLEFTDGDGDIGLYPSDTLPPYDYNFFIKLLKLTGTQLNPFLVNGQPVNYNGRIPVITPNTSNKAIKGMIEYTFDVINYSMLKVFLRNDTIAFDVYICDRALNTSNTVQTSPFVVN